MTQLLILKNLKTEIPKGGFKINKAGELVGYGKFTGFTLKVDTFSELIKEQRVETLRTAEEQIAFTKTDSFKNWLKDQGTAYDDVEFSPQFIAEMETRDNRSFEDIAYRLISEEVAGDDNAVNLLIKYLAPENKKYKNNRRC